MARHPSLNTLGIPDNSSEAKYVRSIDGQWEYGTCIRKDARAYYTKKGVKATMREAEDANHMDQQAYAERLPTSIYPKGPSIYYGPEVLCFGKS